MPSRILSWQQMVMEADPNWTRSRLRPWIYEMSNGRLFYNVPDPYAGSPVNLIIDDGGVVVLPTAYAQYPVSSVGLAIGTLWNNGLVVCIAGATSPQVGALPVYFLTYEFDAIGLAAVNANNFPLTKPISGGDQLWNNGGVLCIG